MESGSALCAVNGILAVPIAVSSGYGLAITSIFCTLVSAVHYSINIEGPNSISRLRHPKYRDHRLLAHLLVAHLLVLGLLLAHLLVAQLLGLGLLALGLLALGLAL